MDMFFAHLASFIFLRTDKNEKEAIFCQELFALMLPFLQSRAGLARPNFCMWVQSWSVKLVPVLRILRERAYHAIFLYKNWQCFKMTNPNDRVQVNYYPSHTPP